MAQTKAGGRTDLLNDGARIASTSNNFGRAVTGARVRGEDGLAIGAPYVSTTEPVAGTVFLLGGTLP